MVEWRSVVIQLTHSDVGNRESAVGDIIGVVMV
jgi:hypothetical protein